MKRRWDLTETPFCDFSWRSFRGVFSFKLASTKKIGHPKFPKIWFFKSWCPKHWYPLFLFFLRVHGFVVAGIFRQGKLLKRRKAQVVKMEGTPASEWGDCYDVQGGIVIIRNDPLWVGWMLWDFSVESCEEFRMLQIFVSKNCDPHRSKEPINNKTIGHVRCQKERIFLERSTPQQIPGIDVSFLGDGQSPSSLSAFEMTGSWGRDLQK